MPSSSKKTRGTIATVFAIVFCPCHLVFTLPLALMLLGGTTAGMFLGSHSALVFGLFAALFVVSLVAAYRSFDSRRRAANGEVSCGLPMTEKAGEQPQEVITADRIHGTQ